MYQATSKSTGISSRDTEIGATLRSLIIVSTSLPEDEANFQILLKKTGKLLRSGGLDRVNQFAIWGRLDGLEERWRVSFQEELADDLQSRLQRMKELDTKGIYKLLPECLQFLLTLSTGRPNEGFKEILESARAMNRVSEITWGDIVRQDPEIDEDLWNNIDYAAPGSDDGSLSPGPETLQGEKKTSLSEATRETEEYSVGIIEESKDAEEASLEQLNLIEQTVHLLKQRRATSINVPEALIVRESIHMLCGMSTDLFTRARDNQISLIRGIRLLDLSPDVLQNLLNDIVEIGGQCDLARRSSQAKECDTVMRRYQAHIEDKLSAFYSLLSNIEREAMDSGQPHVSILRLSRHVSLNFREIAMMMTVLPKENEEKRGISLLNRMVDIISDGESVKGNEDYEPVSNLMRCFDSCFATYWRPIEDWIGGKNNECKGIAFIEKPQTLGIASSFFWARMYTLDRAQTPTFLRPYLNAIMTAGKTSAFLAKLTGNPVELMFDSHNTIPQEQSILTSGQTMFEPLQKRLDRVMQIRCVRKTQGLGVRLRDELLQNWYLGDILMALQHVYLAQQGSINDKAYNSIFRLIDRGGRWSDRFLLTDIYQSAFENLIFIASERITVSVEFDERARHARERSLVRLEAIKIQYAMSWPIANLIDGPSLSVYQRVAKLLLQIARAKHCLDQQAALKQNKKFGDMRTATLLISLQHRLRWFVNALHSYIALDIIPEATTALQKSITNSNDFDIMIQQFRRSMASLQRGCFLSASLASTHQALVSLLDLAVVLDDMRRPPSQSLDKDNPSSDDEGNSGASIRLNVTEAVKADDAKLVELYNTYKQLLSFVHAGVQEASRSSGDTRLNLFAEDIAIELAIIRR